MASKPRSRAAMDVERVARMMAMHAADDEPQDEIAADEGDEAPAVEPSPPPPPVTKAGAPAVEVEPVAVVPERSAVVPEPLEDDEPEFDPGKVDGRTLRKTGREPFATRIKPEAHAALRRIAYARRITMAEALELAVAAFEKRQKPEGRKPTA